MSDSVAPQTEQIASGSRVDALIDRVQKVLAQLKAAHDRALEENARLRVQNAQLKSRGSRVKNVPKRPDVPAA